MNGNRWPIVQLGDACLRITDGTHQSPIFSSSGVPFLVISNVITGKIDWESVTKWVSQETYEEHTARCRPERGDVLYTAVGSFGVAVPVDTDRNFMFQRHIAHIKPDGIRLETRFLAHVLNSPPLRAVADRVAKGVAQRTVSLGDLKRFEIPLPPLLEQRRIADILDKADAIRRKRKQAIALTDQLLRSTFLEMFGDPVTNPKGWPSVAVENIAKIEKNALAIGPFGSNLLSSDYRTAGHPVIFVRDIVSGTFHWKSNVFVDDEKFVELAAHKAVPGDVIITKMGDPPGVACVLPSESPASIITADIVKVSANCSLIYPEYLAAMINSPFCQEQIGRISAGITRQKMTLRDFRQLEIRLPPLSEQSRYVGFVRRFERLRDHLKDAERDAQTLFSSLVDRAFRGELSRPEQVGKQLQMFSK